MLLDDRRDEIRSVLRSSQAITAHSVGFASRVLGRALAADLLPHELEDEGEVVSSVRYGGYPALASLGFQVGSSGSVSDGWRDAMLGGIALLRQRPSNTVSSLAHDDVAVLGIADGLSRLASASGTGGEEERTWFVELLDRTPTRTQWSSRMRALAGDLLDRRGRLQVQLQDGSADSIALEFVMRQVWPRAFDHVPAPERDRQSQALAAILGERVPPAGDPELAVVRLAALDILVDETARSLVPTVPDVARLLRNVQHSLKRWRWVEKPRSPSRVPSRWLIDDEYDVQALLWAVLYPIYGAELVDETYLPNWGNVQPRADLGILRLKLIIEVKFARRPNDFADIEEQVAGDIGLYFKNREMFNRMVVVVYDDCDDHRPERQDSLRNALRGREEVEDVIFLRRPGMLPSRHERRSLLGASSAKSGGITQPSRSPARSRSSVRIA